MHSFNIQMIISKLDEEADRGNFEEEGQRKKRDEMKGRLKGRLKVRNGHFQ